MRQFVAIPGNLDSDSIKERNYLAYGDAGEVQPDLESKIINDPKKEHPPWQGLRDHAHTMTGLEQRSSVVFPDRLFANPTREAQTLTAGATYTSSSILEFVRRSESASVGAFVPSRMPLMNHHDQSRICLRALSAFSRTSLLLRRAVKKKFPVISQTDKKQ